jgi:hypothetical protein
VVNSASSSSYQVVAAAAAVEPSFLEEEQLLAAVEPYREVRSSREDSDSPFPEEEVGSPTYSSTWKTLLQLCY